MKRICLCFDMVIYLLSIDLSLMCPLHSPLRAAQNVSMTQQRVLGQVLSTKITNSIKELLPDELIRDKMRLNAIAN